MSIINTKKALKDWMDYELEFYKTGGIIRKLFPISEKDILRKHQILLRKTEYYNNTRKKLRKTIYKIRLIRLQNKYSLHIPLNVCEKGLRIVHLGPIIVNEHAHIGEDCAFHINTAVVAGGTTSMAPNIGNGVVLGIGAVVLGDISIADHVAIGANAVVNKSIIENNITVGGVPAKKISNNGRLSWGNNDLDKK
ncbi:serine acetyltransferase [Enterococcus faecium]|nr:serine acetyltransferase [Enterococcus faecium]